MVISGNRSRWRSFPPKFYCGLYSILLNLGSREDVRYLRIHWKMSRWSKRESMPMFGFYVYAEESGARVSIAVASDAALESGRFTKAHFILRKSLL